MEQVQELRTGADVTRADLRRAGAGARVIVSWRPVLREIVILRESREVVVVIIQYDAVSGHSVVGASAMVVCKRRRIISDHRAVVHDREISSAAIVRQIVNDDGIV